MRGVKRADCVGGSFFCGGGSAGFCRGEVEIFDQLIEIIFAAGDKSKRDNLAFGEKDERGLVHGEFVGEWLGEIGAHKFAGVDVDDGWIAGGFEAFGGDEFGEWGEIVVGFFEPRIGGRIFGDDDDGGVDGVSGGVGRALENGEENLGGGGVNFGAAFSGRVGLGLGVGLGGWSSRICCVRSTQP